jgi:transposase
MPPSYVAAYVKRGKTDAADAAAICEAVTRRQRARRAILEAFAPRPLKLIEGEVLEVEAAETLATERESVGESMGSAEAPEANSLEDNKE